MPIFQRAIKAIQYADDGPGALGAGEDTEALTWNNATGHFTTSAGGGGGNIAYTDAANAFTRKQTFHAAVADATLGSELVTDGTFPDLTNWNDDASGWNALNPGLTHNIGATGALSQDVTIDTDNVYLLEISVTGRTAGSIDVYNNGSLTCHAEENGVIRSLDYVPTDTDTIHIDASSDFDGTLEYVSLKASVDGTYPIGFPSDIVLTEPDGFPVCFIRSSQYGGFFAGYGAGRFARDKNLGIGDYALDAIVDETGNVGIGTSAGSGAKNIYNMLLVGAGAGTGMHDASDTICIGANSGIYSTSSNSIIIGPNGGANSTANNVILIGASAGADETVSNTFHLGNDGDLISGTMDSGNAATQTLKFHAAICNFADIPTDATGLSTGDLYNDGGFAKFA